MTRLCLHSACGCNKETCRTPIGVCNISPISSTYQYTWESVTLTARNAVQRSKVQWNSVIMYPQGKWKKVRTNQSTFYPKRDFPHWQDRFHVFTWTICHGRCFSAWMAFITRFSYGEIAFQGVVNLKTCREIEIKTKRLDHMLVIRKKRTQKRAKKCPWGGGGELVRNIRFCATFCMYYPKKMYMFSDWRCPWSTKRTL